MISAFTDINFKILIYLQFHHNNKQNFDIKFQLNRANLLYTTDSEDLMSSYCFGEIGS